MKTNIIVFAMVMGISGVLSLVGQQASAATTPNTCSRTFLGIPTWFNGLTNEDRGVSGSNKCDIVSPDVLDTKDTAGNSNGDGLSKFIWRIVLNVIDIALRLVAWVAAGMMIYGGFKMITSDGAADKAAQGRKTILNAAIGLVIAIGSVGLVNLVMGIIN